MKDSIPSLLADTQEVAGKKCDHALRREAPTACACGKLLRLEPQREQPEPLCTPIRVGAWRAPGMLGKACGAVGTGQGWQESRLGKHSEMVALAAKGKTRTLSASRPTQRCVS